VDRPPPAHPSRSEHMTAPTAVPRSKVRDAAEAVAAIRSGMTLMVGGFGLVGSPLTLIEALRSRSAATELTIISNNLGEPGRGLGRLLLDGRVRKAVGSYYTSNPDVVRAHLDGNLEVELVPQGTLAESIRAGGAGIGGFFTRTGLGTPLTEGCEERVIHGEHYVFQESRRGDVALVRARAADELGNLVFSKTARNFNPDMATAADLVIAEVDEIVPVGALDPEAIVTPHLFVDVLVRSKQAVVRR
jgi:3-oxoacid CoA-transferase A subunit